MRKHFTRTLALLLALMMALTMAAVSAEEAELVDETPVAVEVEATEAPAAAEEPAATEVPDELNGTTEPVDNATDLPDGEYEAEDFTFAGGSGKAKISCTGVTVASGKAYATLVFGGSYVYVKANGETFEPTAVEGGNAYTIPVALGKENAILACTTAMSQMHEVAYTISVNAKAPEATPTAEPTATPEPTQEPEPTEAPAPVSLSDGKYTVEVESNNKMFKVVACTLTVKNGAYSAVIALSGTGYDQLFVGTAEEAEAAESTVAYELDDEERYTFAIPVAALDTPIVVSAHSAKNDNWLERELTFQSATAQKIEVVAPTKIAFANKTETVNLGETLKLNVVYTPANASAELTWSTSKAKVATVANGVVTPVAEGKATITVVTDNKKKASVTVQVVDPNKVTKIAFADKTLSIAKGAEPVQLVPVITPAGANAPLTWKSSKTAVATVDAEGKVTAVAEGKAKITVTAKSGKKATITVQVFDPLKVTAVKLDKTGTLTLKVGETAAVTATVEPATAQESAVLAWTTSKAKVATVEDGVITAVATGSAKITVTAKSGKKATIKVKVTK